MIMCTNDVESALRKVPLLCKGSRESGIDEVLIDGIVDLDPSDGGFRSKIPEFKCIYLSIF